MASIFDVAKYILHKKGKMSTWKLQKLCYYAQAWELAWTEKSIFCEDFEAWTNGPVCRSLFNKHRGKFTISEDDIPLGDPDELTSEQQSDIDIILHDYGEMAPYDLRELTHSEKPWKQARGDLPETAPSSEIISKESMGEYYGSL